MTHAIGSWDLVTENAEVLPVHAALLPSGKVLFFSGSEHDEAPVDPAGRINATRIWDPADNRVRRAGGPLTDDLFCCGHCLLPSGDVFVAGGTEHYEDEAAAEHAQFDHFTGSASAMIFDWRGERWRPAPPMAGGRWYPTCVTMADGRVMVLSGHGDDLGPHENTRVEIFDATTGAWSAPIPTIPPLEDTGGITELPFVTIRPMVYYPRLHQVSTGSIFSSTPLRVNGARRTRDIQSTRYVRDLGPPPLFGTDPSVPVNIYARSAFASVLLPLAPPSYNSRIMIFGQRQPYFFEPNNAHLGWREAGHRLGSRDQPAVRAYANGVLLPDGTVLFVGGATSERLPIFGGGADSSAVHHAERYDPRTDTWQDLAASPGQIARVYHSVALLLPDGRVWIAGSNHDSDRNHGGVRRDDPAKGDARELRIETFSPPYLFTTDSTGAAVPAPRPATGRLLAGAGHGQLFRVETPDAAAVRTVHLVRSGSATHAFNPDQRLVVLDIVSRNNTSLTVRMPPSGIVAPPGYYMLFLLNAAGTPSVGRFIRVAERYPIVAVYLGRPLTTVDPPDLPAGVDVTNVPDLVWDIGTLDVGATRRALLRCRNVGTGPLRLSDLDVTGDFRTEPTPDSPLLGIRGQPKNLDATFRGQGANFDEYAEVELLFRPTEAGPHTGVLGLHTNAEDLGYFVVHLRADVAGFEIELAPASGAGDRIRFGAVDVAGTAISMLTVRNRGTVDGVIEELTIGAETPSSFSVPGFLPNPQIPAGQARQVAVVFTPATLGPLRAVLTVHAASSPAPSRFRRELSIILEGVGIGPRISLTPNALSYGPQLIRTQSTPRTVTVANAGSGPLVIRSILASGDWTVITPVPAAAIAPNAATVLEVAFRPGSSGPISGTLIVDGGTADGPAAIAMDGTGVAAPIAILAPAALDFGTQPIGTQGLAQGVSITNDGAADLHVTGVGLTGPDAADFRIVNDGVAGAALRPEESAVVEAVFVPGGAGGIGPRRANVEFTDDAAGSPRTAALTGTASTVPAVGADPTALHFAPRPIDDRSSPQILTLTNNGQTAITVNGITATGPAADDFVVRHTCGAGQLASGGSCTIEVVFQPTTGGPRAAELTIAHDGATLAVPLTGTGLGGVVTFDPTELYFGLQPVGTFTPRQDVLLLNTGNAALTLTAVSVTGDFRYAHACSDVIGPGGFCRISIIFQPTAAGVRTGEVSVTDGLGNVYTAALTGTGVVPQAALSTAGITFGDQAAGDNAHRSLQLTNVGTGPLIVAAVTVDGDNAFSAAGGAGSVLMPAESCSIDITFAPTASGTYAAVLKLATNAADSPHLVTLDGAAGPGR